jgi:hypothetical protein
MISAYQLLAVAMPLEVEVRRKRTMTETVSNQRPPVARPRF